MVLTNEWRMSRAAIEGETVARAMQARRARHCHFIPIAPLFTIINNYHIIFPIIDPSFIMLYHTQPYLHMRMFTLPSNDYDSYMFVITALITIINGVVIYLLLWLALADSCLLLYALIHDVPMSYA